MRDHTGLGSACSCSRSARNRAEFMAGPTNEIERRKKAMEDSGLIGDGGHDGVIDIFIDELVATYHKQSERAVA